MSVRAKFRVDGIKSTLYTKQNPDTNQWEPVEMKTIELSPVYSPDADHENKKFWDATPSGKVELGVINPAGSKYFELGQEYYLDFTKAEKA